MKKLLILFGLLCQLGYSQTTAPSEYELRFNASTGLYEARVHVLSGNLNGGPAIFRRMNPSKFTVVVPSSVPNTVITATSVAAPGTIWTNTGTNVYAPAITPGLDYRLFNTDGGGDFASFAAGDDILLFTFSLPGGCVEGVRIFDNNTDPQSTEPSMLGADLNNSLQTVPARDQYTGNRTEDFFFEQTSPGDWNLASTWLNGRIPTPYSNVRITHTGQSIISTEDYVVDNLELLGVGSELIVETGRTLGVTRDVTNNGDFTGDGIVELIGPCGPQDLIGTGSYNKLIADNTDGVNVITSTVINGYLNVDNGIFTTNNATTFPCDFDNPTGTPFTRHAVGQIGPVAPGGAINGEVIVEQCFPGRRAFRMVSASTTGSTIHNEWQENPSAYNDDPRPGYGTHITGLAVLLNQPNALALFGSDQLQGLDWQPSGTASMFSFNNGSQSWENVLNTNTTLTAGIPYLMTIRGSRAVNLELNTSPASNTKLESTGTPDVNPPPINPGIGNNEFALIGNPFHAVVDLNQVIPGNGYTNFVTVFDPNIGGATNVNSSSTVLGGRGGYVTVDVSTGNASIASGITGVTATDATQFVQPYQSFFVQGATTGTPGALTFQEANKAVEAIQTDVFDSSEQPRIFVNLFDKESLDNLSTPDDGLVIYFSANSSNIVDDNDAPKFFNQDEVIARNENNSLISFENRAMPVENDVLELYTNQYRTTDYVLEIGVQFLPDHDVYLYDKYTNAEVLLSNNASNTYVFSVEQSTPASIATDRFGIVFETSTLGSNEFDLQGISVYPNPTTDILNISLGQNTGRFDSLELFDINGRLIAKQSLDNQLQNAQMDVNAFSSGVYILKVSSEREQFSTKVIVE